MNANLLLYALRSSAVVAAIWAVGMALFSYMIVALSQSFQAIDFLVILQEMPPALRRSILGTLGDLGKLEELRYVTYMAVEYFSFWLLIFLGMYPLFSMGGTLAREAEKGTLGILLAQPVDRWKVALMKYLSFVFWATVIVASSSFSLLSAEVVIGIDNPLDRGAVLQIFSHLWFFLVGLGAVALAFSAFFLTPGAAWGAVGVMLFASYLLNITGGFEGPLQYGQYFSVYYYWQPANILVTPTLVLRPFLVYGGMAVVGLAGALLIFERREIPG